ncbi:MAG: hypothetical protein U1F43_26190 [Myxococcota bacterium]
MSFESKFNRVLTHRYQITASEQMAPADTTVETANLQKLTIPAGTLKAGDQIKITRFGQVTTRTAPTPSRAPSRLVALLVFRSRL